MPDDDDIDRDTLIRKKPDWVKHENIGVNSLLQDEASEALRTSACVGVIKPVSSKAKSACESGSKAVIFSHAKIAMQSELGKAPCAKCSGNCAAKKA